MKRLISAGVIVLGMAFSGSAFAAADGAAIFKAKCSPCHGAEGQGTAMAPAFKGNQFVKDSKEEQVSDVIKNGRAGAQKKYKQYAIAMPKQNLSDEEIKAVIAHLKSLASKQGH